MVGTPSQQHHTRHRRVAAILARRAIAQVSPIRDRDRRAEGRRLARDRRRRARAALLRGMREVLGLPQQHRRRRQPQPQQVDLDAPIVLSSDSSAEDQQRTSSPSCSLSLRRRSCRSDPRLHHRSHWWTGSAWRRRWQGLTVSSASSCPQFCSCSSRTS